jgi:glycolate oxidase iron-sulfur subunit
MAFTGKAGFRRKGRKRASRVPTYNILEPEIALRLRDRKIANIVQTSPALVATGNIGCIAQIASGTSIPVLHTIELLDFAHGGPTPDALASLPG